jgi:hypothetical protein
LQGKEKTGRKLGRLIDEVIIEENDLLPYCEGDDLASKAKGLLLQQQSSWELLRNGYSNFQAAETREFDFDGFVVKVQFNPGRFASSSAKVDENSIKKRQCFLCPHNLPREQRGLLYSDKYLILCNPFPIFPEHFTISSLAHTPQRILKSFETFLSLSKELQKYYTVLYNGPKCGASAPDHMHFQAGNKYFMPIEQEYEAVRDSLGERIVAGEKLRVHSVERYLRKFISFESSDLEALVRGFEVFYLSLQDISADGEEPMMNIIASFSEDRWRVVLFPRAKHRPSFFFEEGEKRILISPAAVDLGGVCITPLERDFKKITKEKIIEMFSEVSLSAEAFGQLKRSLRRALAKP